MLRIGVISLMPRLLDSVLGAGVIGRAIESELVQISHYQPRDYVSDPHRSVDDRPFGGGPGMLLQAQPMSAAVQHAKTELPSASTIAFSPQGERLNQSIVNELALANELVFVAARYEGMDERFIDSHVDREISVGDYVLSGGELPALVTIDAIVRIIDGTLGNKDSAKQESFWDNLLEGPQYTRPQDWEGVDVPDVLLSGNHAKIDSWNREQALQRTWERRPELLLQHKFTDADRAWLRRHLATLKEKRRDS